MVKSGKNDRINGNFFTVRMLEELKIPALDEPIPGYVDRFIAEAEDRINLYLEAHESDDTKFVPADYREVYLLLRQIKAHPQLTGNQFLEWGSGFGVATLLASLLGFKAAGIEHDAALVAQAQELAADFDIRAKFRHASFLPKAAPSRAQSKASFNVVYAYPWPEEEYLVEQLFDTTAPRHALLLTYHGCVEFRLRRKT